jgi:hypothetical protein
MLIPHFFCGLCERDTVNWTFKLNLNLILAEFKFDKIRQRSPNICFKVAVQVLYELRYQL